MNINPLVILGAALLFLLAARPLFMLCAWLLRGAAGLLGETLRAAAALVVSLAGAFRRNPERNPEVSLEGFDSDDPGRATWRSYVAEIPAWFIVLGALSVSFWTQVFAVNGRHFAYWEALVWGASTDAGTIAFLFLAREGIRRNTPTWGAWIGSVACAFMSVQWNVIPAWETGDILGVESHLWMPALALGTWYWLLHGRKRRALRNRNPIEPHNPELEPEPEPPAPLPPRRRGALPAAGAPKARTETRAESDGPRVTRADAMRAYRKLAAKGPVSGAALGRALGVSGVSGRNWLRKVQASGSETRPFRLKVSPDAGQEVAA